MGTPMKHGWMMAMLLFYYMPIFLPVVDCQMNANAADAASLLSTADSDSMATVAHPAWDKHIKDLERLLEMDLERIKQDAAAAATVTLNPGSADNNNGTLAQDLLRVRQDIDRLVASVKDVEQELGRTKDKIAEEERDIEQKNAAMEMEKFLDGLHRGKVNMKVDYVTGQLVSKPKLASLKKKGDHHNDNSKRMQSLSAAASNLNISTSVQEGWLNATSTITGSRIAVARTTNDAATISREQEEQQTQHIQQQPYHSIDGYDEVINAAANGDSNVDDDEFLDKKKKASETVRQHIESHPDIQSRIKEEMEFLKLGSDPAVLNFDITLMLDIVKLAMTASLFGLAAVFLRLPPTAGFLLGGMLIGPSCLDVVREIHQVQTLAQFGAIFLLFEQGLLYSQSYSDEHLALTAAITEPNNGEEGDGTVQEASSMMPSSSPRIEQSFYSRNGTTSSSDKPTATPKSSSLSPASSFLPDNDHDPNVVGSIILILLVFVALAIVVLTNVANSIPEAIMVSCTIALCSTTIVAEALQAAHLADTVWGIGVLKMISMHDLFMVPLLALPELLSSLNQSVNLNDDDAFDNLAVWGVTSIIGKLALVAVFLKASTFLATHIIRAASYADGNLTTAKGELFTLSVVAYVLLVATVSDELSMSIEAGAVLAGVALFRSPYVPKVLSSIQSITSVFGGMYLTSLGMIISPEFVWRETGSIIELVCLIGFFKLALVSSVLNRFFDYGITPSVAVGSAMAQISEVSLLILAKSQRMGLIRRKTYLLLIPTTCIMLGLAPLSAALLRRLPKLQDQDADDQLPLHLCLFKYLRILRRPSQSIKKKRSLPIYAARGNSSSMEHYPSNDSNVR